MLYVFYGSSHDFSGVFSTSSTARQPNPEFDNLLLTESQCQALFPGLTFEIEREKSFGPFELPFKNRVVLQAKIENDEVKPMYSPLVQ